MSIRGTGRPEGLRVYDLALQVAGEVEHICRRARCSSSLKSQLRRCSESVVLNIAEGAAHFGLRQKQNFYRIAHGSAGECLAALDILARHDRTLDLRRVRSSTSIIATMLLRLINRFDAEIPALSPAPSPEPVPNKPPQKPSPKHRPQ